jgi:hypothetical protein
MLTFLVIVIIVGLVIAGLIFWWRHWDIIGAFVGFIPINVVCLFYNYADTPGGPTKETTNQALIVALAITAAPLLLGLLKELVSGKNRGGNQAGNARNAR